MEQNPPGTPKEQLRAISILCYSLIIGPVLFLLIIVALIKWNGGALGPGEELDKYFLMAASALAIICLVSATSGYKKRLLKIQNFAGSFNEKLENYRAALILYFATCEGAALFSVMALFLTGNYWLILVTIVMLLAMVAKRPTKQRLVDELQLNSGEQQELE